MLRVSYWCWDEKREVVWVYNEEYLLVIDCRCFRVAGRCLCRLSEWSLVSWVWSRRCYMWWSRVDSAVRIVEVLICVEGEGFAY